MLIDRTIFTTRFAPSPTGYLHLGHAFSALTAFDAATRAGGRFLLRIEDIDRTRCRPEFAAALQEDLAWLGLAWADLPRVQSQHFSDYARALDALKSRGLVYRCFKTRKEVLEDIARAPHLSDAGPMEPAYFGAPLAAHDERERVKGGAPYAWRLSLSAARDHLGAAWDDLSFVEEGEGPNGERGAVKARPDLFGDVVIARKDAATSYHLAAVHDDAAQGVTHVIRGHDLFHAAHVHRLLQVLLGLPQPTYRHHRLITDDVGRRLAKRDEAATLRARRAAGETPEALRRGLGFDW